MVIPTSDALPRSLLYLLYSRMHKNLTHFLIVFSFRLSLPQVCISMAISAQVKKLHSLP